jgi:hypothetical protein
MESQEKIQKWARGNFKESWQFETLDTALERINGVAALEQEALETQPDEELALGRHWFEVYKTVFGLMGVRGDFGRYDTQDQQILMRQPSKTRQATEVKLPFEGDRTLAVILSKAFLLANDKSIKDPTITRQIRL